MQTSPAEAEGRGSLKRACKKEKSMGEVGGQSQGGSVLGRNQT